MKQDRRIITTFILPVRELSEIDNGRLMVTVGGGLLDAAEFTFEWPNYTEHPCIRQEVCIRVEVEDNTPKA